ncbi:imidazole glycerol phosphate synthase subunit HisH [Aristaeella hokkaidonensis]|uniref:Imidazole glycerol phosphate synthase subunit HisH n=1 Tax=Aristaeella hokkaidonensis TaxID=3046382 RepID=A0AC61N570_9FIRM|nr:imidazole glycerol phosphate synthase subunit HisH [Aristaeella hokkaidonensis]QUC68370.1 imidazole glycerol phosphate synthase subunit HisH [Aristaeella hokkaidonensis]SNT95062.1 glutamine amidotransferase [Aristaeella hokkaidonensis]
MIAIIDYGVGNLFSLRSSFAAIGQDAVVTSDIEEIRRADRLILPGVGAFQDAAEKLRASGMDKAVKEETAKGKPLMGVCLGMQMLFERSYEYGEHEGLGLLKGEIRPIAERIPEGLKIPQMGWNALRIVKDSPLLKYTRKGEYVYFVHSYSAVNCEESLLAVTEYGADLTACVGCGNVFGCQFHPEKSGEVGLRILKAFCEIGGNA